MPNRGNRGKSTPRAKGSVGRALALRLRRKCSARECRRRATTILRYLDNQERPDHQTDACDTHASEICAELRVTDRRR